MLSLNIAPIVGFGGGDEATKISSLQSDLVPGGSALSRYIFALQSTLRATHSGKFTGDTPLEKKIKDLMTYQLTLPATLDAQYKAISDKYSEGGGVLAPPSNVIGQLAALKVGKAIQDEILESELLYPTDVVQQSAILDQVKNEIDSFIGRLKASPISGSSALAKAIKGS